MMRRSIKSDYPDGWRIPGLASDARSVQHRVMFTHVFNRLLQRPGGMFLVAVALMLAACEARLPQSNLPEMTFRHLPPIALRVVDIQLVNSAKPGTDAPHVAHLMPVPPAKALTRWAEDRLQIAGNDNTARFTILESDVTETSLKLDKTVTGLFKKQQSERYDAIIEASLEIFDRRGIRKAVVSSRATRSVTVAEDMSINDRRRIWYEMMEKLMTEFNSEMDRNIGRYMTEYRF